MQFFSSLFDLRSVPERSLIQITYQVLLQSSCMVQNQHPFHASFRKEILLMEPRLEVVKDSNINPATTMARRTVICRAIMNKEAIRDADKFLVVLRNAMAGLWQD